MNDINRVCPKCSKPYVPMASFCVGCGARIQQPVLNAGLDPYVGQTIDHTFIVESLLGSGSMGIVYKARHRALDTYVALKVLRHDFLGNRVVLTRFQREAQAASSLSHPNVIRILHYGKTFLDAPYIAMECLEGPELADVILRDFPMDQKRVANLVLQITYALDAAHSAGIIHRDLKPANIVVSQLPNGQEQVKVLDFGIAKIADSDADGLTREGAICGTPAFMSPEQVLGRPVTPASDIFSLGSIMYFMLCNRLPFHGASTVDMASSILSTQPTQPSRVRLDVYVDPEIEKICLRALEKDVSKRFPTAREMGLALEYAISKMGATSGVRASIVVGERQAVDLDGETQFEMAAYPSEDEEVALTSTSGPAYRANEVPKAPPQLPERLGNAVSAVGQAVSHVFSVISPVVPSVPGTSSSTDQFELNENDETSDELMRSKERHDRKRIMLGLIIILSALILVLGIAMLILLLFVDKQEVEPCEDVETPKQLLNVEVEELSEWDVLRLVDLVSRMADYSVGIGVANGISYDANFREQTADKLVDEINPPPDNDAKPVAAPKPVAAKPVAAKPVAAKPVAAKPVAAKPVAAKPVAAPKPKRRASSGSYAKALAAALKAEDAGKKMEACEMFKALLKEDLSKDDKLIVQGKVRGCGRMTL